MTCNRIFIGGRGARTLADKAAPSSLKAPWHRVMHEWQPLSVNGRGGRMLHWETHVNNKQWLLHAERTPARRRRGFIRGKKINVYPLLLDPYNRSVHPKVRIYCKTLDSPFNTSRLKVSPRKACFIRVSMGRKKWEFSANAPEGK